MPPVIFRSPVANRHAHGFGETVTDRVDGVGGCDMVFHKTHSNAPLPVGKSFTAQSTAVSENGVVVGGVGQRPAQTEFRPGGGERITPMAAENSRIFHGFVLQQFFPFNAGGDGSVDFCQRSGGSDAVGRGDESMTDFRRFNKFPDPITFTAVNFGDPGIGFSIGSKEKFSFKSQLFQDLFTDEIPEKIPLARVASSPMTQAKVTP